MVRSPGIPSNPKPWRTFLLVEQQNWKRWHYTTKWPEASTPMVGKSYTQNITPTHTLESTTMGVSLWVPKSHTLTHIHNTSPWEHRYSTAPKTMSRYKERYIKYLPYIKHPLHLKKTLNTWSSYRIVICYISHCNRLTNSPCHLLHPLNHQNTTQMYPNGFVTEKRSHITRADTALGLAKQAASSMTARFALCILPGITCRIWEPPGGHWGVGLRYTNGGQHRGRGNGGGGEHGGLGYRDG